MRPDQCDPLLYVRVHAVPVLCCASCYAGVRFHELPLAVYVCRELGDFDSAMESFQKALLLNQNHLQSLQLRGMMLYHHGSLQDAIGNFKAIILKVILK